MATILITGANRGIGFALAKAYRDEGHRVIGTVRDLSRAADLTDIGAEVRELDVTSDRSVKILRELLRGAPVDVLINNAGTSGSESFGSLDYAAFSKVIETNVFGPLRVTETLVDNLAAGKMKKVASISSHMGSISTVNTPWAIPYRTSKAALNMAMRSVAIDLSMKGTTTLVLHPGIVETDMGGKGAPVKPHESAAGLKKVIEDSENMGELQFLDYQGRVLPW